MIFALLLALGIGSVAGLRSLTAPAVVAWAAHLKLLDLERSPLAFMGTKTAVIIFTLLAIGELVADKLPGTPKRIALAPLLARIATGAFSAICVRMAHGNSFALAAIAGGAGALIAAFAGYELRRRLVATLNTKDFVVAVCEDLVAIGLAVLLVHY